MCRPAPWSTRSSVYARDAFPDINVSARASRIRPHSTQEKQFNYCETIDFMLSYLCTVTSSELK